MSRVPRKANIKTHFRKGHAKKITSNAVEAWGCLQDDPHRRGKSREMNFVFG